MAIEPNSNPPVYTFTVNNTSAPTRPRVSRTIFTLTSALIANRTYRFSFDARVVSGSVPSADHIRLVCGNDNWSGYWPCLDGSGLGTTWKTFTKVIKVTQNCTKGAIEYNATTTGSKKFGHVLTDLVSARRGRPSPRSSRLPRTAPRAPSSITPPPRDPRSSISATSRSWMSRKAPMRNPE